MLTTNPGGTSGKVPRPMNAWLIFRGDKMREIQAAEPHLKRPQGELSKARFDLECRISRGKVVEILHALGWTDLK